jgi:hypothetical protein
MKFQKRQTALKEKLETRKSPNSTDQRFFQ